MNAPSVAIHKDGEIDLRVVGARLRSRLGWIAASVVVFSLAFIAAAFLITPVYRAATVVVHASADRAGGGGLGSALGRLGGIATLAGLGGGSGGQLEEALAVMRSREFIEAFIQKHNLMPELFAEQWNSQTASWSGPVDQHPTLAQAYKKFDNEMLDLSRDKMAGLTTISIEWTDPNKAALWLNAFVAMLNDEMRARAIANSTALVGFLEKELQKTGVVETRQSIGRLMEAQINEKMLATVTQEYVLRVVDRALPPELTDEVKPNKMLLAVLGPVIGLLFGAVLALITGTAPPSAVHNSERR